ncbi:MAG: TonB-dependent receptor [Desulfobacterales bacterium]|nr:TonB-dependent receptor [Desulfobacterales bacterium]
MMPSILVTITTLFLLLPLYSLCDDLKDIKSVNSKSADTELDEELRWLKEESFIIVASLTPERVQEAPSSVTVFTHEEIKSMGATTVDEILRFVPGFDMARETFGGSMTMNYIRGHMTYNRMLFLFDGERLNDAFRGADCLINRNIPVYNIKRIEIIRGPGSAIYGSNAFSGVVNIVPFDDVTNGLIHAGDLGRKGGALNYSGEHKKVRFTGFVNVYTDHGDFFKGITDKFNHTGNVRDPQKGYDLSAKLNYEDLSLKFRYIDRSLDKFLGMGVIGEGSYFNRSDFSQLLVSGNYKHTLLDDTISLDASAGYSSETDDMLVLQLLSGTAFIASLPLLTVKEDAFGGIYDKTDSIHSKLDFSWKAWDSNRFSWGISYQYIWVADMKMYASHNTHNPLEYYGAIRTFTGEQNWADENATRNIFAFYVEDRQEISDFLIFTLGSRFDRYSDFGSTLNPRSAITFKTSPSSTLKLMYGSAFRAPNFGELYTKNNPLLIGNPDLKPEKINTYELAYNKALSGVATLELVYYYNHLKDLIQFAPQTNITILSPWINSGEIKTQGVETEIKLDPTKNLSLRVTYSRILDSKENDTKTDVAQSINAGSFVTNYSIGDLNLNLSAIFKEKIKDSPYNDGCTFLNSSIQYKFFDHFGLGFTLNNITNIEYKNYSPIVNMEIPHRGRTVYVSIEYQ